MVTHTCAVLLLKIQKHDPILLLEFVAPTMADKLSCLRCLMASHSPPLHALLVPSEDYHQSEYVSDRDKRRQFISGFTGTAGLALITMDDARLWTDGRYFLQAEKQLSNQWKLMRLGEDPEVEIWMSDNLPEEAAGLRVFRFPSGLALITMDDARLWTDGRYFLQAEKQLSNQWKLMRLGEDPEVEIWMSDNLPEEAAVGVDPWCLSIDTAQRWQHAFQRKRQKLVQTSTKLVDQLWNDRPVAEVNPVKIQTLEFSGRSVAEKLHDLRDELAHNKAHSIVVTALDEVAWLYNIRGSDVSYCPVVHAYAVVTSSAAFFYVDQRKVSSEVHSYMEDNKIEVRDYASVGADIESLTPNLLYSSLATSVDKAVKNVSSVDCSSITESGDQECNLIWMDPGSCCYALYSKLIPNRVFLQQSPLALPKSMKNPIELDGLRKSHIRDGAAVVQFLVWLDEQMQKLYGASGYFNEARTERKYPLEAQKLTEVSVSDKLKCFRASKEYFRGLSFHTTSSIGSNAAIIHYKAEPCTCAEMDPDKIYLFDSGAQYQDGTTDITRTVHFGLPSAHEKACYTSVLKGHIALDNARFPKGTTGYTLDILARAPLWKDGLDYLHGTGHGIGSYLNVHEGPHSISFRPRAQNVPLQATMAVTNEPGYYEDGNFGIRLENVLIVKDANTDFNFGDKGYLEFEHITWAPFQQKLIDSKLMTPDEINWVNDYHSRCREILAPYMNEAEIAWLKKATEPICT